MPSSKTFDLVPRCFYNAKSVIKSLSISFELLSSFLIVAFMLLTLDLSVGNCNPFQCWQSHLLKFGNFKNLKLFFLRENFFNDLIRRQGDGEKFSLL